MKAVSVLITAGLYIVGFILIAIGKSMYSSDEADVPYLVFGLLAVAAGFFTGIFAAGSLAANKRSYLKALYFICFILLNLLILMLSIA